MTDSTQTTEVGCANANSQLPGNGVEDKDCPVNKDSAVVCCEPEKANDICGSNFGANSTPDWTQAKGCVECHSVNILSFCFLCP